MELSVQKRETLGKAVKDLRRQGLVPAELYGRGLENLHLAVLAKELNKIFKQAGENTVINLIIDKERRPVLIYGVQTDPVSDSILNVDFYQVRLDEKIKVKIPIEFIGTALAVKDKGGVLVKAMQEIEVEALPADLPQSLQADLSGLIEIGLSLRVKDLNAAGNVKLLVNPETVIATVTEKLTEEKEAELAQEVDVSEIKSETEEKKQEREAGKTVQPEAKPETTETPKK